MAGTEITDEPVAGPVQLAATPAEAENTAAAEWVLKNRAVEADMLTLPALRNEILVLPEDLKDLGVQTDLPGLLEAAKLLLTLHTVLTILQHHDELDAGEVYLREGERTLILFHDAPTLANELGGIDGLRAVDCEDPVVAEHGIRVPQEGPQVLARHALGFNLLVQLG